MVVNHYEVFDDAEGKHLVAFAKQKGMKIKEEVTFYTDADANEVFFSFKATSALDIHGKNIIKDSKGNQIGYVQKDFKASLARSAWVVYDNNDTVVCRIQERSMHFAIIRRVWDFIPILGEFPLFGRVQFDYITPEGKVIGTYDRRWSLRDEYDVTFSEEAKALLDARVAIASFIMLDALQNR